MWHKIKETLTLQFILLPEFSLFFWDRAALCFVWDNSQAHGGFWGLKLVTECWSSVPINVVLLWGTSFGEGRSQTKPFLALTMSFHKSHAAAAGILGLFFPRAAVGGHCSHLTHRRHACKMVTSLLAMAFLNFSSLCPSSPSENTDVGCCLHHRGGDISKAAVGTGSWEELICF